MSHFVPVALAHASRLINHGPTVLVTTAHFQRRNVMAAARLECRLIPEPHAEQACDTCFAEVVAAAADPRIFAGGRWTFEDHNADLQTIHHLGGGVFARAGGTVRANPA